MNRNSMNRKNWNESKIDYRSAKEIEDRIEELAISYVPEWHFDRENPDIGSVISKIFAYQMEGNIERYNQVLERYHTEFVNMLGISLLPARPAEAIVLMDLVQDTIPGVEVYKGTKLLAEAADEDAQQIVFETIHNLYVTNSTLEYVFMTESDEGRIVPLKGNFRVEQIVEGEQSEEEETAPEAVPETEESEDLKKFRLFASGENGIQKNALLFYHTAVLDVENDNIYVKLTGDPKLTEKIRKGEFRFWYYAEEDLLPVEHVEVLADSETVILQKERGNRKIEIDGVSYSLLALLAETPVRESITLTQMKAASSGSEVPAEFVNDGDRDFDVDSFDPFGDTLSLYQECYLGHDTYFSKADARIHVRFEISYPEHRMMTEGPQEEESLKIIKRKPRAIRIDVVPEARAEEISFEYYNGVGWKKLKCDQEIRALFAGNKKGTYEFSFLCPKDWESTGTGAYEGRCIRIRLLKSDNCYMRPGIHHYPHIERLRISYSYEEHYVDAQRLEAIAGTRRLDFSRRMQEKKPFTAFSRSRYDGDSLYLGFSRKMESGPVSILFRLEEGIRFDSVRCRYDYSTVNGFKPLKVLDYTMDLSRSGTLTFMPPADMHAVTMEGNQAYWLRLTRIDQEQPLKETALPIIRDIRMNAVHVRNVETKEEEDFYLDESVPGMTIGLGVPHILDIDLWVNETGTLSRPQMASMLEEAPEMVRAEYDILGEIASFYVKWQEADQLDDPPSRRSYMLDRMNSTLTFGDGLKAMIPTVLDDVAFKTVIRCCNGQEGNVEIGRINESLSNLMFVGEIHNPARAYGGSSIENFENALKRGSNILKSRRRLVSTDDYLQEIVSYSDAIDKAGVVIGDTIYGEYKDRALSFVILMKDFTDGSYSFHSMEGNLKKHLLKSCELTIAPEDLAIVEPIFARVSVDAWVEVPQMDDSFAIQHLLQETLAQYLNPVKTDYGRGWEIGTLPRRSQLLMRLNVLKNKAIIKKIVITVRYTDQSGSHETDLDDVKISPFMVCCSGTHRVNIMVAGEGA